MAKWKPSRRIFQFSLRSFFVATVAAALFMGWQVSGARRKNEAIERIHQLGGTVVFDYQWSDSESWLPDAKPPGHDIIKAICGEYYAAEPVEVHLGVGPGMSPQEFNDIDAEKLATFGKLKWLDLQDTKLTDDGLKHFVSLKSLERLDVEGTSVSEAGVEALNDALPELNVFY